MDKTSLSRSSSVSSFEQINEKKTDQDEGVQKLSFIAMRIKLPNTAITKKILQPQSDADTGTGSEPLKRSVRFSDPIVSPSSPRVSSSAHSVSSPRATDTSATVLTSDMTKPVTTISTMMNVPMPVSSAIASVKTDVTTAGVNEKKGRNNSPTEIARALIRAETAVNNVPYAKEMNAAAVDRFLRGKVEERGVNLIETLLAPFVDSQFGGSEFGNLFRQLDQRFMDARPQIDALKNTIAAELDDPILYTDTLLQRDQRFVAILDAVIKPLLDYVKGDDTVESSKLPAPFLQLLKAVDNEILEWYDYLSEQTAQTDKPAPSLTSLATVRKNAMVALIAIRSLSVMFNKSHGSQVGGEFVLVENHLVKTINKKLIDFVDNLISCPNARFEKLMREKRSRDIVSKASMRSGRSNEGGQNFSADATIKRRGSFSSALQPGSVSTLETKAQLDSIAKHNQVLISLFVKKYKLNQIDTEFSLFFQEKMSKLIDSGEENLSEKAIKKECLKLLTDYMLEIKKADRALTLQLEKLYQSLSGHAFSDLLEQ